jgi:hypothetical protein
VFILGFIHYQTVLQKPTRVGKNLKLTTALSLKHQIAMKYTVCYQAVFPLQKRKSEIVFSFYKSRIALF